MSNLVKQSLSLALSHPHIPVYITKDEVDKMLGWLEEDIRRIQQANQKERLKSARRKYIFIKALFQTGARVSELLSLEPSMVHREERTIRIVNLKRHKIRKRGRPLKNDTPY